MFRSCNTCFCQNAATGALVRRSHEKYNCAAPRVFYLRFIVYKIFTLTESMATVLGEMKRTEEGNIKQLGRRISDGSARLRYVPILSSNYKRATP